MLQKRLLIQLVAIAGFTLLACHAAAQDSDDTGSPALKESLKFFAPYEGTWEIDGEWTAGGSIWARNEYMTGMNGNFFTARTWSRTEAGKVYQRYETTWRINPENERLQSYGFTYDGTVTITESEIDNSASGHPVIRARWQADSESPHIKQEVQMNEDETSYQWRVWSSPDGDNWTQIMDGVWKKIE